MYDYLSGALLGWNNAIVYICCVDTVMFINNDNFSAGGSSGDGVSQPGILWSLQGNSVQINCTHNKGVDYKQMYWYQQRKGESLSLIVFTKSYGPPEFRDSNQSKFEAHKLVPESGSLTVKNAQPDDSAKYFCSVSKHSVSKTGGRCTKTLNFLSKINNISYHPKGGTLIQVNNSLPSIQRLVEWKPVFSFQRDAFTREN